MRKNIKRRVIDVLIVLIVASLTFLIIPAWLPFLRRGWQLLVFATILLVFNGSRYFSFRAIVALITYFLVLVFHVYWGDVYFGSISSAIYEILILFVPSSLILYYIKSGNTKTIRMLVYITIGALLFEVVSSFIIFETNPGIIRSLAGLSSMDENPQMVYEFYKLGLMDYTMGHAIPIFIPTLFCHFKENVRKWKWISLVLIIVCVFLVWLSESSTALLLTCMMLILGMVVSVNATLKKQITIIIALTFITIILFSNSYVLNRFFDVAETLVDDNSIYVEKIEELRMSSLEDRIEGDMEGRIDKYDRSLSLFLDNIFWGSNQMPGRHSGILDRLALLGLSGFIPLALFFFFSLKEVWKYIPQNRKIYYLESMVAAFLMLLFKAMWLWTIFLFLFVLSPCVLYMRQQQKK